VVGLLIFQASFGDGNLCFLWVEAAVFCFCGFFKGNQGGNSIALKKFPPCIILLRVFCCQSNQAFSLPAYSA
jgi:hypothetical protein